MYVPNPYDSDTGLALRSSQGERLHALGTRGARGAKRGSRSPGKRSSQSKSPRRRRTTGGSQFPGPGLYGKDPKSPGRDRNDLGRGRGSTTSIIEAAAESVSSSEVEVEAEVEAVVRSNTMPASAFISSYIDDVNGFDLLREDGGEGGGGGGGGFRGLDGGGSGGSGGFRGLEEHTPNVVRRARLREQQQQQQLQQRISDQLNISTLPRPNPTTIIANAVTPSSRISRPVDKGGIDYSPDAYYALYAAMNISIDPPQDPSYLHSSLCEGVDVTSPSPLVPNALSNPAPYPRRALYAQAPVVRNFPQEREGNVVRNLPQERDGKDRPAMSDDAVANISQAAQMRRSQRTEQNSSPPVPVSVFVPVSTGPAPLLVSTGSIIARNIPASLESSIADLADIMYALGAAKSSMKPDRPRRGQRDIGLDRDYTFNMDGPGSGSLSGSDLHSVRSTSTDGHQPHT